METSALYKSILSVPHYDLTRVTIGNRTYDNSSIISKEADIVMFENGPELGKCISRYMKFELLFDGYFDPMDRITVSTAITDGTRISEYLPQGVFLLDTQGESSVQDPQSDGIDGDIPTIVVTGYDAMMLLEADFAAGEVSWPISDKQLVQAAAAKMNVSVDSKTLTMLSLNYPENEMAGYCWRERLSDIAARYGGVFFISKDGKLTLATPGDMTPVLRVLGTDTGKIILFGGGIAIHV